MRILSLVLLVVCLDSTANSQQSTANDDAPLWMRYNVISPQGDKIAFASSFPGQILAYNVQEKPIIVQKRAFLAMESSVDMKIHFQKKLGAGLFGGEGFIMQKFSGNGYIFLEIDGSLVEYDLEPNQTLILDTGYLAAMEDTVTMDIVTVKGVSNVLFGGEGLFNTKVTGPGKVWIQSMPITKLAGLFNTNSK